MTHHSQFDDDDHVDGCLAIQLTSKFNDVTNKTITMANKSNAVTTFKIGHQIRYRLQGQFKS